MLFRKGWVLGSRLRRLPPFSSLLLPLNSCFIFGPSLWFLHYSGIGQGATAVRNFPGHLIRLFQGQPIQNGSGEGGLSGPHPGPLMVSPPMAEVATGR
jgi:hypothetical protein